jgi:hypothetical protein
MTQADFVTGLEMELQLRGVAFDRADLVTFAVAHVRRRGPDQREAARRRGILVIDAARLEQPVKGQLHFLRFPAVEIPNNQGSQHTGDGQPAPTGQRGKYVQAACPDRRSGRALRRCRFRFSTHCPNAVAV